MKPTDEQIKEYADGLPSIYRAILSAFPGMAAGRRSGDGLTVSSIEDYVEQQAPDERLADVAFGLEQLEARGFVTRSTDIEFYMPTPLGERLITAVTGKAARPAGVPPLPEPSWG